MSDSNEEEINEYIKIAKEIRRDILDMIYRAKAPHIGSSFSIVELLVALYFRCLSVSPDRTEDENRDIFIPLIPEIDNGQVEYVIQTVRDFHFDK